MASADQIKQFQIEQAYNAGVLAQGSPALNPYPKKSVYARAWARGYGSFPMVEPKRADELERLRAAIKRHRERSLEKYPHILDREEFDTELWETLGKNNDLDPCDCGNGQG